MDQAPAIGTGLLAVFCDLAPEWLDEFRPWLVEEMFPPRTAIGFGPAASFDLLPAAAAQPTSGLSATPQGFLTAYVTPALGSLYGRPYQSLRGERGPRDAAFHGERMQNQARYVGSWVGPGIETASPEFLPVLVIDRFDIDEVETQSFNIWLQCEYLPDCARVPGLGRLRRYRTMEGAPGHLLLHEFESEAALADDLWLGLRASQIWQSCRFAPGAPAAYRRVISASAD